jgi:hypothetical protein
MADTSLFTRLRRLFSNDVIIRNVGGKQLRVIDSDRIQQMGNLQNNSLYDRFTRLHRPVGSSYQYNPTLNYQTMRLQLYSDYEAMDTDPLIASTLDIVSEEATLKDEYGDVLTIKSTNDNIKRILHNLFYDVLNIEFNLPSWTRNMCKYGDFYLKLDISEKYGVYNVIPLYVYDVVREEGRDPENPNYVKFLLDPNGLASGTSGAIRRSQAELENYEVAHFRLMTDANFLPYGRSYLEPARKIFKQWSLMEDAMLIHRIMRAPDKRTYYINVGGIPPNEIDAFMEQTVQRMKKTPYIDQQTGEYNLKYNMQNMIEDFYIPVRGNDASTRIENTPGLNYDGIQDVEYLKSKMLAALKIPKPFLNYDENVEGKATISAMDIRFARTIEKIQRILVSELTKIALVHLYAQGFRDEQLIDFELQLTPSSIVFEQEKIELYKSKVELANSIMDKKVLSTDFIYKNVFNLSPDEALEEKEQALEDAMHIFRTNQIENEGNDPVETGESYGTPHDLASLYSTKRDKGLQQIPTGYDEENPVGRPKQSTSTYGTEKSAFGRDPLGQKRSKGETGLGDKATNKVSTFALEENRGTVKKLSLGKLTNKIKDSQKSDKGLLSEENIIEE